MAFYLTTLERRDFHQQNLPAAMDKARVGAFIENAQSDPINAAAIRSYLSLHELLATGVNLKILDEDVIVRFAGSSIVAIWTNYSRWIYEQRRHRAEPSVFCELEDLAMRIEARLALNHAISVVAATENALRQSSSGSRLLRTSGPAWIGAPASIA